MVATEIGKKCCIELDAFDTALFQRMRRHLQANAVSPLGRQFGKLCLQSDGVGRSQVGALQSTGKTPTGRTDKTAALAQRTECLCQQGCTGRFTIRTCHTNDTQSTGR